jgi:protoporphyrinogen oxidase
MVKKNIAVVGAGPMGLVTAYKLLLAGHDVTIYEADKIIGGMSASFDFDGLKIERYYHFICKSDESLFSLLKSLGIDDALKWRDTKMGYFYQNKVNAWGDPIALLKFPNLGMIAKIRYGLMAFIATKRSDWEKLDQVSAVEWLKKWVGEKTYNILWKPLFELKLYQYSGAVSAAWIWSRLRRVGTSRRNIFQESLGYLEGGSDTLLYSLKREIEELGGIIKLSSPVEEIVIENDCVRGVTANDITTHYDQVISTIPLPYVSKIIPKLPQETLKKYSAIDNIAVVCVLVKLKKSLTDKFWLNISDPEIDIPGLVEYSNLCPLDENIIYVPYYLPGDHPKYQEPDEVFIAKVKGYLKRINPAVSDDDIICIKAGRYRYAQPICGKDFLQQLPPINPGVRGLLVADTSYYYPEDRSISESIKLANHLAELVLADADVI